MSQWWLLSELGKGRKATEYISWCEINWQLGTPTQITWLEAFA
jgi:hypothetical protein